MRTELIHIRTTIEIKKALRAAAEAEGRTVTNYIEWLLKKDLEQKKQRELEAKPVDKTTER